jgi:hypothetical protein
MAWSGAAQAKNQKEKGYFWKLVQQLRLFCAELPPDDAVESEGTPAVVKSSAQTLQATDASRNDRHSGDGKLAVFQDEEEDEDMAYGEALLRPAPSWTPVGLSAFVHTFTHIHTFQHIHIY